MRQFLKYSLEHNRRIKAILCPEGVMTQQNITIQAFDEETFTYTSAKQKKPRTLPMEALLCAGYARGDRGEGE